MQSLQKEILPPLINSEQTPTGRGLPRNFFGLKAKVTFFVILNVAGVLFVFSYIDYRLSEKDQVDLYFNRNLYIAKQVEIGIPNPLNSGNLPQIREEMEEWLLSRPSILGIDLFVFSATGLKSVHSTAKLSNYQTQPVLTDDQIKRLHKDIPLFLQGRMDDERLLEVIIPIRSGKKVIGAIRVSSSYEEANRYLSRKRIRALILTLASILFIFAALALFFRKLVGDPVRKIVDAMAEAENGNLMAEAPVLSRDEIGELARNFNQMLQRIRETHQQNVQLLAQVNQFNEELSRKIHAATSELAGRNEELKLLNEALFDSQRKLGQSEKLAALGQVTAIMAHQMGTPLNSISGYIQLMLREGNPQGKEAERLKIINSQLDRLAESVRSLLTFTRPPKPLFKPLQVNAVLEELIRLSEPWLQARNITISNQLQPDLPQILGDPIHLQTLFLNIITNALDAMPAGGTLTLATRQIQSSPSSENKVFIEIQIIDTGVGIPAESKQKIFEPFFTTKDLGKGTGLGLSICSQIIQEHWGWIEVESHEGKGSAFSIRIPVYPGE